MTDTRPLTFGGMNIIIAQVFPKMTLSPDVPVSPEFRKEMDAWMLGYFGTVCYVPDDKVYVIGNGPVVMNQFTYDALVRANEKLIK